MFNTLMIILEISFGIFNVFIEYIQIYNFHKPEFSRFTCFQNTTTMWFPVLIFQKWKHFDLYAFNDIYKSSFKNIHMFLIWVNSYLANW